jgi:hypothetical protein
MKIKDNQVVIILCVTVGGILLLGVTKLINSGLSVLVGRVALALIISGIITLAVYIVEVIVRAIRRHTHRLHH